MRIDCSRRLRRLLPLQPLLALAALLADPRLAAAAPAAEGAVELDPLVVTATPIPEQSLRVPAAIGEVDREDLVNAQRQIDLSESLAAIPGVAVRNRYNYAQDLQIQSRGFGARSSFGVRGLQIRLDGIPITASDGQGQSSNLQISSLQRIEVLRGPLAYAYGNASGGVVAAFSEEPPPDTRIGLASGYGADDTWRLSANVGGHLADDALGYRLDATRFHTDGFREHSAAQRSLFSGELSWAPDADTRTTLLVNTVSQPQAQDPLGLTREQLDEDPQQTDDAALLYDTRKTLNDRLAGLRLEHRFSASQSAEVVAWGDSRNVQQFQSIPVATQQSSPTQSGGMIDLARDGYGAEGRYRLQGQHWSAALGLQAQRTDEERRGYENFVGETLGVQGALRRDEDNGLWNVDEFLLAQWQPDARWTAIAALRHSDVRFDSNDHYVTDGNPDDSGNADYSAVTPALGVNWLLRDRSALYLSWGRGFETPTFSEISYRPDGGSGLNLALDDSTSQTWELGWKEQLSWGGRLGLAIYRIDSDDEIVPATNSGGRATYQNAGGTRRRGMELGIESRLLADFSTTIAAEYLDAEFRDDYTYSARGETVTVDSGNQLPGTAKRSLYAELAWRKSMDGLSAALDARCSDEVPVDDVNSDAASGFAVWNLRLQHRRSTAWGLWTVYGRIDNLTDRRYAGSVIVNDGNGRFFEPAPGRSGFAGIELEFGP